LVVGDLLVKELHRRFLLLRRLQDECSLVDPFGDFPLVTNILSPAEVGAAAAARRETVCRLKTKYISRISL
jgi:hypothetical protein